MEIQSRPSINAPELVAPFAVAVIAVLLISLLREPARRNLSAILLGGAGAAYLSGGLGVLEILFCTAMTVVAYQGLRDYRWIGLGWLMHTSADVAHHLYGNPILPMFPLSSFGCALCDLGLALWYLAGAPSPYPWAKAAQPRASS